jgi:septal ring factor EnvC (AmiA/AmiB activator)
MTDTGHEARARAVVEQIQRRHTREVRAEIPAAVRDAIMEVAERMAALEQLAAEQAQMVAEQAGTIARLTAELVETKTDLERFRANIREIGAHLTTERAA